jgi:acetyl esterase/lipase
VSTRRHNTHIIVLPGGGYTQLAEHEGEPVVNWLRDNGIRASVFWYPIHARHPIPLTALRREIDRLRAAGATRVGVMGFSAGGHLGGLAALAPGATESERVDFAVLGYAITSMQTATYRPAQDILLGPNPSDELRRATSLDALVTPEAPPFFLWHTAEDPYVHPEHTYLLSMSLARHSIPHTAHVFPHGPHSLALAAGAGAAAEWPSMALRWLPEYL